MLSGKNPGQGRAYAIGRVRKTGNRAQEKQHEAQVKRGWQKRRESGHRIKRYDGKAVWTGGKGESGDIEGQKNEATRQGGKTAGAGNGARDAIGRTAADRIWEAQAEGVGQWIY